MNSKLVIALPAAHRLQFGVLPLGAHPALDSCTPQQERGFVALLRHLIRKYGVRLVAEEFTEDALKLGSIAETTCRRVAKAHDALSEYIDLNDQQQNDRGAMSRNQIGRKRLPREDAERECRKSDEVRETHWTRRILELNTWPCLFVHGGYHTDAIVRRLNAEGVDVQVLREWTPEIKSFRGYSIT